MNVGRRPSEEDAHAVMDVAHEAGINFFDTANSYGSEPGETEIIIARVRPCSLWAASADKS